MSKKELVINAEVIELEAEQQIHLMKDSPAFRGLISIMPDVHLGKGSVIGFTGKFDKVVIPNVVGVDIGCGVSCYELGDVDINFKKLDEYIRENIPLGFNSRSQSHEFNIYPELCDEIKNFLKGFKKYINPELQLGTLGGGNHFIEIDKDEEGNKYLLVHSGSRNFGLKVANHFQNKAKEFCKVSKISTAPDLEYLPLVYGGEEYMKWLKIAQQYAHYNRLIMTKIILNYLSIDFEDTKYFESVHNFIASDNIIRKGAVQALKGQKVIIPFSMSEGAVIGIGRGNHKYNMSAPHGSGRLYSRTVLKNMLKNKPEILNKFKEEMKDIFTTSVNEKTIDESPMAYKTFNNIEKHLNETIIIEKRLKPIYNLKSE